MLERRCGTGYTRLSSGTLDHSSGVEHNRNTSVKRTFIICVVTGQIALNVL